MHKQPQSFYTIRFPDCDPFGHLNNSRYLDYMLNAREDHLKEFYDMKLDEIYKSGQGWMVTAHQIAYIRPALYNEQVCIQSQLIDAGDWHLLVEISMWNETKTVCKALLWTKFVPVNLKTGRPEKHQPEFSEFVQSVLHPEADLSAGLERRLATLTT